MQAGRGAGSLAMPGLRVPKWVRLLEEWRGRPESEVCEKRSNSMQYADRLAGEPVHCQTLL